jgi:hypothetical protein
MLEQPNSEQQPFIELNRRFRKLDQKAKAEETALESYTASLLDAALSVIASPDEPEEIKQYAAMAIGTAGSAAIRAQLSQICGFYDPASHLYPSKRSWLIWVGA